MTGQQTRNFEDNFKIGVKAGSSVKQKRTQRTFSNKILLNVYEEMLCPTGLDRASMTE